MGLSLSPFPANDGPEDHKPCLSSGKAYLMLLKHMQHAMTWGLRTRIKVTQPYQLGPSPNSFQWVNASFPVSWCCITKAMIWIITSKGNEHKHWAKAKRLPTPHQHQAAAQCGLSTLEPCQDVGPYAQFYSSWVIEQKVNLNSVY
jgi:hypothetical protein